MRILVIQHDADKGLGLFVPPLAEASLDLDVRFAGHEDIEPADHAAVIALPGVANPDEDSLAVTATRDALREALRAGLPVLGICLGAELLAEAAGAASTRVPARVGLPRGHARPRPRPRTSSSAPCPGASRSSRRTTSASSCRQAPSRWPARTATLQAFRVGACAWGVQFHPEPTLAMLDGWTRRSATSCRRTASIPRPRARSGGVTCPSGASARAEHGAALCGGRASTPACVALSAAARRGISAIASRSSCSRCWSMIRSMPASR